MSDPEIKMSDEQKEILSYFETHSWHLSFNTRALSEFIETHPYSSNWDVVLMNTGEGEAYPDAFKCGNETLLLDKTEKRHISVDGNMISISRTKVRVGSGGCTRIGLTNQQIREAKEEFIRQYGTQNVSDKAYLIKNRPPILMLHVIQAEYDENNGSFPNYLYALGIGFPKTDSETATVNYKVNLVELRNWMEIPDYSEEDSWE